MRLHLGRVWETEWTLPPMPRFALVPPGRFTEEDLMSDALGLAEIDEPEIERLAVDIPSPRRASAGSG